MANTSSALKAIRSAEKKKARNDVFKAQVKDARRELTKGLTTGAKKTALAGLLTNYYKQVDKAAKGGKVYSKNKAARLKARMAKAVAA